MPSAWRTPQRSNDCRSPIALASVTGQKGTSRPTVRASAARYRDCHRSPGREAAPRIPLMVVILIARIELHVRDDGRRRLERVIPMIEVRRTNGDREPIPLEEHSPIGECSGNSKSGLRAYFQIDLSMSAYGRPRCSMNRSAVGAGRSSWLNLHYIIN